MPHTIKLIILGGILGAVLLSSAPAQAQTIKAARERSGESASDVTSVPGCPRPADAKEVKVVDFDPGRSVAKLAVNLGSGRFKLVRVTVWDRPEDPRPLIPVIEAARITQGNLQFYAPDLNSDPESAHESFIVMTEMGGGYVCWATPSSLMNEGSYPVAEGKPAAAEGKPVSAPAAPNEAPRIQPKAKPASAPAAPNPAPWPRARTKASGQ